MPVLEQMPDKAFHSDFHRTRNNKIICKFIKLNQTKRTILYSVIMSLLSLGCKMFPHGMCSPVCVICMYVCLYTCWHRGWPWVSSSLPVQLYFEARSFGWTWSSLIGYMGSNDLPISVPLPQELESQIHPTWLALTYGYWGLEPRSSHLHGRSFTYWAITIDPLHCLMSDYFLPLLDIIN